MEAKADFAITPAMKTKQSPGPPMTTGNVRENGARESPSGALHERELATLARGDARHERTDQGNERHDAFLAIQTLRQGLGMAPADVQTRWDDAIAKAQVWVSSFN